MHGLACVSGWACTWVNSHCRLSCAGPDLAGDGVDCHPQRVHVLRTQTTACGACWQGTPRRSRRDPAPSETLLRPPGLSVLAAGAGPPVTRRVAAAAARSARPSCRGRGHCHQHQPYCSSQLCIPHPSALPRTRMGTPLCRGYRWRGLRAGTL